MPICKPLWHRSANGILKDLAEGIDSTDLSGSSVLQYNGQQATHSPTGGLHFTIWMVNVTCLKQKYLEHRTLSQQGKQRHK